MSENSGRVIIDLSNDFDVLESLENNINETGQTPTRSINDTSLIVNDLRQNGYCVVGNVLSCNECEEIKTAAWEWLSSLGSGINKDDPKTWGNKNWATSTHGLIQHYGIGQAAFCWKVRMNHNVRKVFSNIWGTSDLVTSFDGVCIKRPPELTKCHFESKNDKSWLHCDQSKSTVKKVPSVNGWQSIQSGVNLEDSTVNDGCFRVMPGSHLLHASSPWEGTTKDWYKLSEPEISWYKSQGCVDMKISCPKGGMVLWDSRAIHASTNPVKGRENPGRFRYTVFVCMNPRRHVDNKVSKRRRDAFESGRTTSHWPARMNLFGKNPRTYGKEDVCKAPPVELKEEWKSLI